MFGTEPDVSPSVREPGGLNFQRCRWCGLVSFRRQLCPACGSSDFECVRSAGEGIVVETAVVHRYTHAARNESLVRFPEGILLRCRVIGVAPHRVRAGAPVRHAAGADTRDRGVVVEVYDLPSRVTPAQPPSAFPRSAR